MTPISWMEAAIRWYFVVLLIPGQSFLTCRMFRTGTEMMLRLHARRTVLAMVNGPLRESELPGSVAGNRAIRLATGSRSYRPGISA